MDKNTKIVIGAIAILLVMIFVTNPTITGESFLRKFWSIKTRSEPTVGCTDTDGGKDYYEKGFMKSGPNDKGQWDSCYNLDLKREEAAAPHLIEYYCENNKAGKILYKCPNGCESGACIGEEIPEREEIPEKVTYQGVLNMLQKCRTEGIGEKLDDEYSKRDLNGDGVVTGAELCTSWGRTCLFTADVNFNIKVDGRNIMPMNEMKGCFGGNLNSQYIENPDLGMIAWCCKPL